MAKTSHKIYIHSSVLFAFIDRAHPKHEQAGAFFRYFAQEEYQVYVDFIGVMDTYNKIYKEISPSLGKDFLRTLSLSNINIIYPEENDTKSALKALVTYQSTDLTYSDAVMAVVSMKRNIPHICTFDYLHSLFGLTVFYLPL